MADLQKNIESRKTSTTTNTNSTIPTIEGQSKLLASSIISREGKTMKTESSSPKRLFAECALVEIIHLHDCLRGALQQIQNEVNVLVESASVIDENSSIPTTVKDKDQTDTGNDDCDDNESKGKPFDIEKVAHLSNLVASRFHLIWSVFQAHSGAEDEFIWPALKMKIESKKKKSSSKTSSTNKRPSTPTTEPTNQPPSTPTNKCGCESFLEQEAYEEDHAEEETMFKQINTTLRRLNGSFRYYHANPHPTALFIIKKVIYLLKEQTDSLHQHLDVHLAKEETQCLPMVKKHLSKEEISTLVGQIMGKRSAEMMGKILNLAVCSLPGDEREDMVKCLKKAMGGTFFEKWLTMGGWDSRAVVGDGNDGNDSLNKKPERKLSGGNELALDGRGTLKRKNGSSSDLNKASKKQKGFDGHITDKRLRHPSRYYAKEGNETVLIWDSVEAKKKGLEPDDCVPQCAQSELIPTFTFDESRGKMIHGCEHYARSCKLRHPETGQLFTCRLCCEDVRQSNKTSYETLPVLERHAVTEIMCMQCGALQPAGSKCANEKCEMSTKGFAKYCCSICNLYDDDETRQIYHCPYCNVCRKGKGLGIDFRHCMRCNACINIDEYDSHVCISQRLQGNCPICNESMFESTEPLRGMKCGHVMHLSCFDKYVSRCFGRIPCPICKQSFENGRG